MLMRNLFPDLFSWVVQEGSHVLHAGFGGGSLGGRLLIQVGQRLSGLPWTPFSAVRSPQDWRWKSECLATHSGGAGVLRTSPGRRVLRDVMRTIRSHGNRPAQRALSFQLGRPSAGRGGGLANHGATRQTPTPWAPGGEGPLLAPASGVGCVRALALSVALPAGVLRYPRTRAVLRRREIA